MKNTMKSSKEYYTFVKDTLVGKSKSLEETHIKKEMTHLQIYAALYLKGYDKDEQKKNHMVKENQISIIEFELVFSPLIQCHSRYNTENTNVCYARREPSHALH